MGTDTDNNLTTASYSEDENAILDDFDVFPGDLDFLAAFGEFTFDPDVRCFESDKAQEQWLSTANPLFEEQTPTQMLKQPEGLARVLNLLLAQPKT